MKKLQAKSTRTVYENIKRGNHLRDPMKTLLTRRTVKFALSAKDTINGYDYPGRAFRGTKLVWMLKWLCLVLEVAVDQRVSSAFPSVLTSLAPQEIIPSSTIEEPHRGLTFASVLVPAYQGPWYKIASPCRRCFKYN